MSDDTKTTEPLRDDLVVMLQRMAEARQLFKNHKSRIQERLERDPMLNLWFVHMDLMTSWVEVLIQRVRKLEAHQQESVEVLGRFTQAASKYTEQQTGRDRQLLQQVSELIAEALRTRDTATTE